VRAALSPLPSSLLRLSSCSSRASHPKQIQPKEVNVADTKKIAEKAERKKVKRLARKKAAPKAKRTTPRGSLKKKVKKMVRGQSKR
jgi:hypothetical protein